MSTELSRRDFTRMAFATAAGLHAGTEAVAEPPAEADKPSEARRDDSSAHGIANHLLEAVRKRYPDPRLSGNLLVELHRDIDANLLHGDRLRQHSLTNADEPGFTFAAYRSDSIH